MILLIVGRRFDWIVVKLAQQLIDFRLPTSRDLIFVYQRVQCVVCRLVVRINSNSTLKKGVQFRFGSSIF